MIDVNYENERMFLAIVLNHEELLNLVQIKDNYFQNLEHRELFKKVMKCFKEERTVSLTKIIEKDKTFNLDLFIEITTEVFYHSFNLEKQMQDMEDLIFKNFKQEFIKKQNNLFIEGNITYEEFYKRIKKVEKINLNREISSLTVEEIDKYMVDKVRIELESFKKTSDILELVYNDFVIIGALTGAGKSGFLLNLMNDLQENYQCIYFNLEMSKSTVYKRMVSIKSGISVNFLTNPSEHQKELIEKAKKEIQKNEIKIEHQINDIDGIRSYIARVKNKNKHTIVFIDHIGLVKSEGNGKKSLYEQMTEVAKTLRQINLEFDCTIICASQLSRSASTSERITLSMLKDSGELENSASKVLLMQKQDNPMSPLTELDIEVAKNRDGRVGLIKFSYDKTKQIFKEKVNYN